MGRQEGTGEDQVPEAVHLGRGDGEKVQGEGGECKGRCSVVSHNRSLPSERVAKRTVKGGLEGNI